MKEFIIKDSAVELKKKGRDQKGLDVTRATLDVLVSKKLVARDSSCCYYSLEGIPSYYNPTTGSTIALTPLTEEHLIGQNSTSALASLTITLPTTPYDGQIVRITFNQPITSLTINTFSGQALPTIVRGISLEFKYYANVLNSGTNYGVWLLRGAV